MTIIEEELLRATAQMPTQGRLLPVEAGLALRDRVLRGYAPTVERWPLWECIGFTFSAQGADLWRQIGSFVDKRRCYLFLEPKDGIRVVELDSGQALTDILASTFGFEFYISDAEGTYLICFNHHDIIMGAGVAGDWISKLPGAKSRSKRG